LNDRAWLAITIVTAAEGFAFAFAPLLGWTLVLEILVAGVLELLRRAK